MRKSFLSLATMSAFVLAASAHAQSVGGTAGVDMNPGSTTAPSLTSIDKNGDGRISKSEAAGNKELKQQFSQLDGNKDGALDDSEFARFELDSSGSLPAGSSGDTRASKPAPVTDDPTRTDTSKSTDRKSGY
jgi:hypothetical protein